ncbi:hypothetical protein ABBQ38_000173 [Trebouxia sp. C0009 RCD-2024]
MHTDLGSPVWWSQLRLQLPAPVQAARPYQGVIKQKNSSVLPYILTLDDGQEYGVVVKLVDLRANSYRDKQHRDRSTQSYKAESGFYTHFAHRMHDAKAKIPELLHEQWQPDDAGVTIVMEDLRNNISSQATTRLMHQALALDYPQAVLALTWLSKMHADCWGVSPSGVWPKLSAGLLCIGCLLDPGETQK